MLQESFSTATQDMAARALAEARVDADRMLLATHSALHQDADLLSAEERTLIDQLMAAVLHAREHADAAGIEAANQALAKGTENFAAQRMNRGIQKALAGKNIESV
jgi:molecular chaperone HscA